MSRFNHSPLISNLAGQKSKRIPVWFMRQAGRYLPEYRKLREKSGSFINICLNPDIATEITLQPLKRYDLDAAIVFSDILTIPMAFNKSVEFIENKGPLIETIKELKEIENLKATRLEFLDPIYKTLQLVKRDLPKECALIGFAGAPFTLAAYMIEGKGSKDFTKCKAFFVEEEDNFKLLLEKITELVSIHLINQLKAGAQVVQIFDSHAKVAEENGKLIDFCIKPVRKIIKNIRKEVKDSYIICFPRNIGKAYSTYSYNLEMDCISIDQNIDPLWAVNNLCLKNKKNCFQGNLDPDSLVEGGNQMIEDIRRILFCFRNVNHIFNLGHGVSKETAPENIETAINTIRNYEK